MALTVFAHANTKGQDIDEFDGRRLYTGYIQGDASYPTGGYSVSPQQFGMDQLDQIVPGGVTAAGALSPAPAAPTGLQSSNFKVKVVNPTTGAEVANATNLSASVWPVVCAGI